MSSEQILKHLKRYQGLLRERISEVCKIGPQLQHDEHPMRIFGRCRMCTSEQIVRVCFYNKVLFVNLMELNLTMRRVYNTSMHYFESKKASINCRVFVNSMKCFVLRI